eukprot:scaffold249325_cov30-Tisochrysis_lutea.AAC.12
MEHVDRNGQRGTHGDGANVLGMLSALGACLGEKPHTQLEWDARLVANLHERLHAQQCGKTVVAYFNRATKSEWMSR